MTGSSGSSGSGGSGDGRPPLPVGWRRVFFRLPIWLYRARLGWVFGQRLLLLEHVGRTSGLLRRVVLEVVARDDPHGPSWTVASGFGPRSAWYRNLRATPRATIHVGARRHDVAARFLPSEEGGEVMAKYAVRNPRLARRLSAFMGFEVTDGSAEEFRRVGRSIPFVRLELAGRGSAVAEDGSRPAAAPDPGDTHTHTDTDSDTDSDSAGGPRH